MKYNNLDTPWLEETIVMDSDSDPSVLKYKSFGFGWRRMNFECDRSRSWQEILNRLLVYDAFRFSNVHLIFDDHPRVYALVQKGSLICSISKNLDYWTHHCFKSGETRKIHSQNEIIEMGFDDV